MNIHGTNQGTNPIKLISGNSDQSTGELGSVDILNKNQNENNPVPCPILPKKESSKCDPGVTPLSSSAIKKKGEESESDPEWSLMCELDGVQKKIRNVFSAEQTEKGKTFDF